MLPLHPAITGAPNSQGYYPSQTGNYTEHLNYNDLFSSINPAQATGLDYVLAAFGNGTAQISVTYANPTDPLGTMTTVSLPIVSAAPAQGNI
jgi:hypothetical protein